MNDGIFDDFPKISYLFPKISEDSSKLVRRWHQGCQNFHDTVRRTNGRYEVTWPWKEANPRLPDNYQLVFGRLHSRIQGKPELLQKYDSIIKDQLEKEIIEKVKDRTEERS